MKEFEDLILKFKEGNLYRSIIKDIEKPLIEWALKKTKGNQIKAARILGINRNTLRYKIRNLGIKKSNEAQTYGANEVSEHKFVG